MGEEPPMPTQQQQQTLHPEAQSGAQITEIFPAEADAEGESDSSSSEGGLAEPLTLNSAYSAYISQSHSRPSLIPPQLRNLKSSQAATPISNVGNPTALVLYRPIASPSMPNSSSHSTALFSSVEGEEGRFREKEGKWWNGREEREWEEREMVEVGGASGDGEMERGMGMDVDEDGDVRMDEC
ncbi:hypothetical protein BT69DRAFT_450630 [Atractiella rhizophila]|nr:hypothetical protein BT69DRAFT_450630 [Atractiella rhizophila]